MLSQGTSQTPRSHFNHYQQLIVDAGCVPHCLQAQLSPMSYFQLSTPATVASTPSRPLGERSGEKGENRSGESGREAILLSWPTGFLHTILNLLSPWEMGNKYAQRWSQSVTKHHRKLGIATHWLDHKRDENLCCVCVLQIEWVVPTKYWKSYRSLFCFAITPIKPKLSFLGPEWHLPWSN